MKIGKQAISIIRVVIAFSIFFQGIITHAQQGASIVRTRWSNDGSLIAGLDTNGVLYIWDGINGSPIYQVDIKARAVSDLEWDAQNKRIAIAVPELSSIQIWDVTQGELEQSLEVQPTIQGNILIAWSPDGNLLAGVYANEPESMNIWKAENNRFNLLSNSIPVNFPYDLYWNDNGSSLILTDFNGIHIFNNLSEGNTNRDTVLNVPTIYAQISPDQTKFVALVATDIFTAETEIRVLRAGTGEVITQLPETEQFVGQLSWIPGSQSVITRSNETNFNVWESSSGAKIDSFQITRETADHLGDRSPYLGRIAITDQFATSIRDNTINFIPFAPSLNSLRGIAPECLTDADNPSPQAEEALSKKALDALDKGKLPNFVEKVKKLKKGDIPEACAADLIAVAEALIAEG
jgi:WD40 repeat protein